MERRQFHPCYHGYISRKDGFKLLQDVGKDGAYLIRKSETLPNTKVLSVLLSKTIMTSYKVVENQSDNRVGLVTKVIDGKDHIKFFDSVEDLLESCKAPSKLLRQPLTVAVECKISKENEDVGEYIIMADDESRTAVSPKEADNEKDVFPSHMACSVCGGIPEDAVETSCCHNVFCDSCLATLAEQVCLLCKSSYLICISHVTRRVVGSLMTRCSHSGCEQTMSRSELKTHQAVCEYRVTPCLFEGCSEELLQKELSQHLLRAHEDEVVQCVRKCNESETNEYGDVCRRGPTGKFYCKKPLFDPACSCTGGHCGPLTGCNCSACMKKDVVAHSLAPGTYLNRVGHPSKKSTKNENFYCGRMVVRATGGEAECCGPTKGKNCPACRELQALVKTRYADVWECT